MPEMTLDDFLAETFDEATQKQIRTDLGAVKLAAMLRANPSLTAKVLADLGHHHPHLRAAVAVRPPTQDGDLGSKAVAATMTLLRRGRLRQPWLPGMRVIASPLDSYRRTETGWVWASGAHSPPDLDLRGALDLADPATVGAVLAQLREAAAYPTLHVRRESPWRDGGHEWFMCRWNAEWDSDEHVCTDESGSGLTDSGHIITGAIEGEASAAALIALAAT